MIAGMSAGGPYVINLNSGGYYVYCRAHTVVTNLKREEAEAIARSLNAGGRYEGPSNYEDRHPHE
jgi:hypothetical protein